MLEVDIFKVLVGWIFIVGEDLRKEVLNGFDDLYVNGEEKLTVVGRFVLLIFLNGLFVCCGFVVGVFFIILFIDFFGGVLRVVNKFFGDLVVVVVLML